MKRLLILAAALAVLCGAAFAQDSGPVPNDPTVNEDANACYAGGSMEGKCHLDANGDGVVDDFESEILWACGWYVIRVEHGMITASAMPEWCGEAAPACYSTAIFGFSLIYVGPPNAINNAIFYDSLDCTGAGDTRPDSPLIFADSADEAFDLCSLLGTVGLIHDLPSEGWNTPPGIWGCTLASGVTRATAASFGPN